MADDVPNPSYLRGTEREIYQFFNDFLPTGQAVNITQAAERRNLPDCSPLTPQASLSYLPESECLYSRRKI